MTKPTPLVHFVVPVAFFLSYVGTAHAYRPFTGTDADVAELGEFELELGPVEWSREAGHNYLLAPATVLNLGILPRVELVVDFVGLAPMRAQLGESRYQLGDTDVFLKWLLLKGALQEESGLSMALEAGPLLPEFHGENGFGAAANVILSDRWDWFMVHLNNEIALSRRTGNPVWSESLISEFRISETAWPVTELLWERDFRAGESIYSGLVGVIWSVVEGLDLDAAVVVASIAGEPAFEARLGFTWAVQVWEPNKASSEEEKEAGHEREPTAQQPTAPVPASRSKS